MKITVTIADNYADKAPILLRGEYEDSIQIAKDIGYTAVELHITRPAELDRKNFHDLLAGADMTMAAIGTGSSRSLDGLCLTSEDEENRRQAVARFIEYIDLAAEFESVVILGLMRGMIGWCSSKAAFEERLQRSLSAIIPVAEEKKVVIGLEAINHFQCDYLVSLEESIPFAKKYNSDSLKIHIDTYHLNIEDGDITKAISEAQGLIGHVHLSDSNRCVPGMGHYDFMQTIKDLHAIGYTGSLAMECLDKPDGVSAAKVGYNTIRRIFDDLGIK